MAWIEQVEPALHRGAEVVGFLDWNDIKAYPETNRGRDDGSDQDEKEPSPRTPRRFNINGVVTCNGAGRIGFSLNAFESSTNPFGFNLVSPR